MSLFVLLPLVVVVGAAVGSVLAGVVGRFPRTRSARAAAVRTPTLAIVISNVLVWTLMTVRLRSEFIEALPAYLFFGSILVVQTWIDIRERRLPRQITAVGLVLGGIALAIAALAIGAPERIWMAGLGAVLAFGIIGGIYLLSNALYGNDVAFGFGDVLLSPLLGLFLGWLNPGIVAPGLFFGFVIAALAAIPAIILKRADAKSQVPFGPFLALGTLIAILFGQAFVEASFAG